MNFFPKNATLDDKIQYVIIRLLRISTVFALIYVIYNHQLTGIINGLFALILLFMPDIIERRYKVRLPIEYSFLIVAFVYASLVLGGIGQFYDRFWWWDDLLHITSGVLLGFAGFIILYILKLKGKLQASNFLISFFAFTVALSLGVVWEWYEFLVDTFFGFNMQRSLTDTMSDLFTDSLGAFISVYLGYKFMSSNKASGLFSKFVNNFLAANPHIKSKR